MAKKTDRFEKMRAAFNEAVTADRDLRQRALDDVRYVWVEGNQWDANTRRIREQNGRPCYEFNKLKAAIKQVTNDQRQNRPQVKIRATEDADEKLAEIFQGLIRNIEASSNADLAYDEAFRFAVTGGFGAWRIETDYEREESFDQCVKISPIRNPFSVYFDASAREWDRRDARHVWVTEVISRDEFAARYPKAEAISFDFGGSGDSYIHDWWMEDSVRIAEYWYKVPKEKEIVQLSTGEIVDGEKFAAVADELAAQGITAARTRKVKYDQVMVEVVSGSGVLEGPTEWAGKYIPVIPVWGELTNVDGRDRYQGMVRVARDAQNLYNYHRSVLVEMIANAPKQPLMATPAMVEGYETQWSNIGVANEPVLFFNPDPSAPGAMPQRAPGPDFPTALANAHALDSDDIKAVTGIYDASLGARSNETSGRAIMARQREADVGTFDYIDNLSRAMRYQGEILIDLIPKIYDTERVIRVLGEDGKEDYVRLNAQVYDTQTGQFVTLNDLSAGKFDVAITVGPSYTTQRMEAVEVMMQLAQNPAIGPVVADLIAKNLDMPGADELERRMRKIGIRQGFVEPNEEEAAAIQPPQPDPMQQIDVAYKAAQVENIKAKTAALVYETPARVGKIEAEAENQRSNVYAGGGIPLY
jgi:hypothetical protein